MKPHEIVSTRLRNDAEVAALVLTRVFPDVLPDESPLPAVIYEQIGGFTHMAAGGVRKQRQAVMQFSVVATSRAECNEISIAVFNALIDTPFDVGAATVRHSYPGDSDEDGYIAGEQAQYINVFDWNLAYEWT